MKARVSEFTGPLLRTPADFRVTTARRVSKNSVTCPECGAMVGSPCPSGNPHAARRRLATRRDNLKRGLGA